MEAKHVACVTHTKANTHKHTRIGIYIHTYVCAKRGWSMPLKGLQMRSHKQETYVRWRFTT